MSTPFGQPGTVLAPPGYRIGDWEVTGFIASGSWGSVHSARRLGAAPDGAPTRAALKVMSTSGLAPRNARELAEAADREVAFSQETTHPHLIRMYGSSTVHDPERPELDGAVVLVMERAEHSLHDLLGDPGPTFAEAGRYLVQIAEALAHLHAAGWVHGDLKPGNVLLMADGTVRLADFGLTTQIEGTHGYAPPLGSPDYLPPERRTEPVSERGIATRPGLDVWAFGVTANQLLAGGALPFPGSTPAARSAAAQEYAAGRGRLHLSPDLSPAWQAVLTDCLTADPARRERTTMAGLLPRIRAAAAEGLPRRRSPALRVAAGTVLVLAAAAATALGRVLPIS
ncbi:protein kinase [Kitasatospora sp. NPDC005856]|uniref:protein kinase domain-containing protein n=1 Tax=Kitasatospora sp. NPDC005856 TaxID=3154566 RepID=UPI0033CF56A7